MTYDAIVIGGGIIGCSHAYSLSKAGCKVALIEKRTIGGGTTARNFSWINATTKTSNGAYHRLNAASVAMYGAMTMEFGAKALGIKALGSLGLVRKSDGVNYQALRDDMAALEGFGYPCEWFDLEALQAREPNINFAGDTEALFAPADKCLNASGFARLMAKQVRALGGEVLENCKALEIETDEDGRVTGVLTDQGSLKSNRVTVAAGPDTPQVLADLTGYVGFASRFPVGRVPGLLVTTPPVRNLLVRHLNYTNSDGEFHFFQDFTGGLRLASDDTDGAIIDDQSPAHLRHLALGLLRRMQGFLPDFGGEELIQQCDIAVGVRAYPRDGISIAGGLPGGEGLYVIATHSGVTLAPVLGKLMADLVIDGVTSPLLAPFGLERLPGF